MPTPQWSSRPAFYLATVGAAVGLGSIWRLPYQVGSSGGSAFVFVFTLACLFIATPLLVAEFLIGRHSRLNPPQSAGAVAIESGLSTRWNIIGMLGTTAVFAMMASYTVVAVGCWPIRGNARAAHWWGFAGQKSLDSGTPFERARSK